MSYSLNAAKLSSYHIMQQRINILLQNAGHISAPVIYFSGLIGFTNTVVTRDVIKNKIPEDPNISIDQLCASISDQELNQAVQESWQLVGSFIKPVTTTSPDPAQTYVTEHGLAVTVISDPGL
jgi:hypothetical protein